MKKNYKYGILILLGVLTAGSIIFAKNTTINSVKIPANTKLRLPILENNTPAEGPANFFIKFVFVDSETETPVSANISINGDMKAQNVSFVIIAFAGDQSEEYLKISTTAPGYKTSDLELRHRVKHNRGATVTIRMEKQQLFI